jgi:hypothetical protein
MMTENKRGYKMWRLKRIEKLVHWFISETECHGLELTWWTWRMKIVRDKSKIKPQLDEHEKAMSK